MIRKNHAKSERTGGAAILAAPFAAGILIATTLALAALTADRAQAQGPSPAPVPPPVYMRPAMRPRPSRVGPAAQAQPGRNQPVPGAPDPMKLLLRMVRAQQSRPYLAREVTMPANGRETEQWLRWDPKRGMRIESIRPTAGDLLVDNFKQSWAYAKREKKWTAQDSLLLKYNARVKAVLGQIAGDELHTEWVGEEIVAGRAADIVRVAPPEGTRGPSRKFWIDRKTGIRLKMEEIGPGGRTRLNTYFLSLDLSPKFRRDDFTPPEVTPAIKLQPAIERQTFKTFDEAVQAGFSPRQPGYLPSGFSLRIIEAAQMKGDPRITQRYANGITILSLVQTHRMPYGQKVMAQLGKAQNGFVPLPNGDRAYVWHDGPSDTGFALIGNLPDDEMRRIASSVK